MDFDFELRPGEDLPATAFARLRNEGPVVWCEPMQCWLISSYDAVREVLSDVSRFTSEGTPVAQVFGNEGMLVNDTSFHHTLRAVWARHVGVAAMQARIERFTDLAKQAFGPTRKSLDAGEAIDLAPVFREFVLKVIASSFGLPEDRIGVLRRWSELSADTPALELEAGSEAEKTHFSARDEVFGLIDEQVTERLARLQAGEQPVDLIAMMVAATGSDGITPSIARDNIFNFMLGALDTSEKWFGNIVCRLFEDREGLETLKADRTRIGDFIDEVMRFDTVAQAIQRRVKTDGVELAGEAMKAGDAVMVLLGAANRDPVVFTDPDRFDAARKVKTHLGFGFGFHHCLGLNIARAEAIALTNVLLDDFADLHIDRADYGGTWALWGPRSLHASLHEAN